MLGMLCWQEQGRMRVQHTRVAGMGVLCAHVTRGGRREQRQLDRAAKLLRRAGVARVLPCREHKPEISLPVVEALPLYRALADRLILLELEERGVSPQQATVMLRGEYPDSDLTAAAYRLCPWVRQVVIDTEREADKLQYRLYREFGATVNPIVAAASVLRVRFGGTPIGEELCLCAQGDVTGFDVVSPEVVLPEWLEPAPALCALWQAGILSLSQLQVQRAVEKNKFT